PQAKPPYDFINDRIGTPSSRLLAVGQARPGSHQEVVIGVGPAFGSALSKTIGGYDHEAVLGAILTGVAKEGLVARIVKVYHSADLAAIGFVASHLSGSGVGIGLQSRGTTIIHKKGLAPLNNLELFPQSPSLTSETYQMIGRNAARYAKREEPAP